MMQTTKSQVSVFLFIAAFLSVGLLACGGGGGGEGGGAPVQVNPAGLLQGNDAALAIPQIIAYDNIQGVENNDVVIAPAPDGRHIALTQLEVWIDEGATVGEVNQALESVDALIISMIPNVPILLIAIDRPADFAALQNIAAQLLAFDALNKVDFVSMPFQDALPSNHGSGEIDSLNKINQLIATGSIAARNAKNALASPLSVPPIIIVADYFGGGMPGSSFDIVTDGTDYHSGATHSHGYHVLGIIAAVDGGGSKVTGAYPDTALIKAVDNQLSATRKLSMAEMDNRVLQTILNSPGNYITNYSLGNKCGDPPIYCPDEVLNEMAVKFITKVRTAGLENKYLHINSAGNRQGYTLLYAKHNSGHNWAALGTEIKDDQGATVPNLTNILTVENVITDESDEFYPAAPICLSKDSVRNGHISAPGTDITSFVDANGSEGRKSGTSMAAPLITSIAAYLWSLNPDLSPQVLKQRLINSAEPVTLSGGGGGCDSVAPQPFVNAYRTILTADNPAALKNTDLVAGRIRGTILDVSDGSGDEGSNGQFDEEDIEWFLSAFNFTPDEGNLDYSKWDLNGDGYTGGNKTTKFDLDMDRLIKDQVTQTIGDSEVSFDENSISDGSILCYYAYSNLYTGDTDIRDDLIGSQCGMEDCIYKVPDLNSETPSYFKYCPQSNVRGIFRWSHISSSGFPRISLKQEICNESLYNLDDECPDINSQITMTWSEYYPGRSISLEIDYLNNQQVSTDYTCSPDGDEFELYKFPNDPGTDGIIDVYATLDTCYTALKTYIPINPSAFNYPGDCHDWWDNAGETCIY